MFCFGLVVLPCLRTIQFKNHAFFLPAIFCLVFIGYPYPHLFKERPGTHGCRWRPSSIIYFFAMSLQGKSIVLRSSKNIYLIDAVATFDALVMIEWRLLEVDSESLLGKGDGKRPKNHQQQHQQYIYNFLTVLMRTIVSWRQILYSFSELEQYNFVFFRWSRRP